MCDSGESSDLSVCHTVSDMKVCLYVSHITHLSVNPNVIPPGSPSICQYVHHQFCPSNHQLDSQ